MTGADRRTVLRTAALTETGKVRSNNQDQFMLSPDHRLWVVADGMGGHKGGEVASSLACQVMARTYHEQTVAGLEEAVVAANEAVYDAGQNDPSLRGMGTTMVALAVVTVTDADHGLHPDRQVGDEVLAISNVGDSRAYRLTGGELYQVTADHSLVAEMVREGSLAPDEAESHPQKNILTRVIGPYEDIDVDIVTEWPVVGDRYLLCSDGLFNEVSESEIAAVLRRLVDPEDAVDELVRMSLANGARDNTTVVIADVVANQDSSGESPRPLGGAYADESEPAARRAAHAHLETSEVPANAVTAANGDSETVDDGGGDDDMDGRGAKGRRRGRRAEGQPKPKRFTWRVGVFMVLLVALLGGAVASIQWWARAAYYVGFDGDQVAIFQGRPGGVLWVDPERVSETALSRADVPVENLSSVESGHEYDSLSEAEGFVQELEERATVYMVGLDDDEVVVFLQAPGADPDITDRSDLQGDDLPSSRQEQVSNGSRVYDTVDDALGYVALLEREVDDLRAEEEDDADSDDDADSQTDVEAADSQGGVPREADVDVAEADADTADTAGTGSAGLSGRGSGEQLDS